MNTRRLRSRHSVRRPALTAVLASLAVVLSPTIAQSALISFDTDDSYTAGNLAGQVDSNGVAWSGNSNLFQVIDPDGAGFIRSADPTGPAVSGFNIVQFSGNSNFWDGDSDPATDGYSGKIAFSFGLGFSGSLSGATSTAWTLQLVDNSGPGGSNSNAKPLELYIRSNGSLGYRTSANGSTPVIVNDVFTVANEMVTISGELNYVTNTFTLFIDGVQQTPDFGAGPIFDIPVKEIGDGPIAIRLQNSLANDHANYVQLIGDSFSLTVVPEPSTSLLIPGGLLLMGLGRRGLFR